MDTSIDLQDVHAETKRWIEKWCRVFRPEHVDWLNASHPSPDYNCMGFAMGKLVWWEPPEYNGGVLMNPGRYWPVGVDPVDDVEHFIEAAATERFEICSDSNPEDGFEKVTIYFKNDNDRYFMHASLQLSSDIWKSKMAEYSDFEHSAEAFDDVWYWIPRGRIYLRRNLADPRNQCSRLLGDSKMFPTTVSTVSSRAIAY